MNSAALNDRASEILDLIVKAYLDEGQPIGSRTLARIMTEKVSAATIRNVMQDLEYGGLIRSPHTSAGRVPTAAGLQLFVDGLLKVNHSLSDQDKKRIEAEYNPHDLALNNVFEQASQILSGMSSHTGMVIVPKRESPLKDITFVHMESGRALAILVLGDGSVENRLLDVPHDLPPSALEQAGNFLRTELNGLTLSEVAQRIATLSEVAQNRLDTLTAQVIEAGVAIKPENVSDTLIVQGASNMLDPRTQMDLEDIKRLFDVLEKQETASRILQQTIAGEGVQVFIGAQNRIFETDSVSMVVSACRDENQNIIGATGVIGPRHLNYPRIVPLVDYTAKIMGRVLKAS